MRDCIHGGNVKPAVMVFILLVALAGPCPTHAELIQGPAEAFGHPEGPALLTLNDSAWVVAAPRAGDWFGVKLYLLLEERPLYDHPGVIPSPGTVGRGSVLRDLEGNEVGITLREVAVEHVGVTRSQESGKYQVAGDVVVYIRKMDIRPSSVIETNLEALLGTRSGSLTVSDLQGHLEAFRFQHWMESPEFGSYILYEHAIDSPSPGPRVILVFREEVLIGVVHHRDLQLAHAFGTSTAPGGLRLVTIEKLEADVQERLEDFLFNALRHVE